MATSYFNSDLTFINLVNLVLRELKEPESTGSEAVPPELVKDTLNVVYSEVFNDQRMKQSARENDITFNLANDTTLATDAASGATSLILSDSSSIRTSGKVMLLSEIADYTGNNTGTNTLTGVTNLNVAHVSGEVVRQLYPLTSLASTIDSESIQYINVNGIPQQYMPYEDIVTSFNFCPNSYSIYKSHLMFSPQSTSAGNSTLANVLMMFTEKVVPLSADADKPSLIPNEFRIPVLVYGACYKLAASDAFRTSWDWYRDEYSKGVSQYIAFKNNRVKDRNNKRRPSLYSKFM
jgi:hypothetical protein